MILIQRLTVGQGNVILVVGVCNTLYCEDLLTSAGYESPRMSLGSEEC